MHEDVKWIFGLVLAFGIFWMIGVIGKGVTTQSPGLPSSQTEQSNTYGSNSGEGLTYYGSGGNSFQNGVTNTGRPLTKEEEIAQGINYASQKANDINNQITALQIAKKTSTLAGKLSMTLERGSTPSSEYALITASSRNTEKILITGLRIQSAVTGNGANIPKGVALYYQNQVNKEEPIYLAPGESAYIITGRSPLGASFRPNKCTGFFTQYQSFNPGLPSRCPRTTENDLPSNGTIYNDACRDYVNSLPSCRVITSVPPYISPECNRFVTEEISYIKCVNRYKNDRDFYDSNWRVYLSRDDIMYKTRRETVQLVDGIGKIIYEINY